MRYNRCVNCGRHFDCGVFECPECLGSSFIVESVENPESEEDLNSRTDSVTIERRGRWRVPNVRSLFFANGAALVVFTLLAARIGHMRESGAGPGLALFGVVMLPVFGLIGAVNIAGLISAVVMAVVHGKYVKALALLALSIFPVTFMAIVWFRS